MKKEVMLNYLQGVDVDAFGEIVYTPESRIKNISIVKNFMHGYRFAELGNMYGLSRERIRQIVYKMAIHAGMQKSPFRILTTRTRNAVLRAGFKNPEDFRDMRMSDIYNIRGIGASGIKEIMSLLGDWGIPVVPDMAVCVDG